MRYACVYVQWPNAHKWYVEGVRFVSIYFWFVQPVDSMWSQGEPTCGYSIIWTYIINQLYIEMLGERCFCFVFSSRSSKQCTVCLTPYHTYIYTLHMWIIGIEVIVMDMKREDVRDTIKNHWRLVLLMASTIRCVQTERNKTHIARPRHVRFNVSSFNNEIEPRSESIEWVRWSMRWPEKWSTTIWKPFVSHTSQHNTLIVMMKCLLRNSMDTKSLLSWRFYNNFSWLIFSTAIFCSVRWCAPNVSKNVRRHTTT